MTNFTIAHGDTWTSLRKEKVKTTFFVEITQMCTKIEYNEIKILTSYRLLEFQGQTESKLNEELKHIFNQPFYFLSFWKH
jgi:hypothetical protein